MPLRYYTLGKEATVTIRDLNEENGYVSVTDIPHHSLGICHVVTWTRKIESNDEYVQVRLHIPPAEMKSLKIYITDQGTEISGLIGHYSAFP